MSSSKNWPSNWTNIRTTFSRHLFHLFILGAVSLFPVSLRASDIEGPFVSNITSNSAVIWWGCPKPVGGKVFIGKRSFTDNIPPFEVLIPGLLPDRDYQYHIEFNNGGRRPASGTFTLHTAPPPDSKRPFCFAVLCDSRGPIPLIPVRESILTRLLDHAISQSARFICFPGDLVFGYSKNEEIYRQELRLWKSTIGYIMNEIPVYVTMGNHEAVLHTFRDNIGKYLLDGVIRGDMVLSSEEIFAQEFCNPINGPLPERHGAPPYTETCYSFNYGNTHFVFINTNYWVGTSSDPLTPWEPSRLYGEGNPQGRIMDRQMEWLHNDLKDARRSDLEHIFLFGHEPAFPIGSHTSDAMCYEKNATPSLRQDIRKRRDRFWKLLSQFEVLAAFFGHEHNYSRALIGPAGKSKDGLPVWQIITGGAGARLSDIRLDYMPWADTVRVFEKRYHYCLVSVDGKSVSLNVFALPKDFDPDSSSSNFELIDHIQDMTIRK